MATATWIGGLSTHTDPNDASDPVNWFNGISPQNPGDVVLVPAGISGAPVTLDLISTPGTIQTVDAINTQVAGAFDTILFNGVAVTNSTITTGSGTATGGGTNFKFAGSTINGLTMTAGDFAVVTLNDTTADAFNLRVGNNATINLKGNTATSTQITQNNGQSSIIQSVAGGSLVINASGTVSSDATTWLDSIGGNTTINLGPLVNNGTTQSTGSFFVNNSALLDIGESVTVNADNITGTRFSNNGYILVYGDQGNASLRLNARMNSISGEIALFGGAHTATLDVATNMPGAQTINFSDNHGLLKIEATTTLGTFANVGTISTTVLQNFFAHIAGFKVGDTIDLVGVNGTGLTYNFGNDLEYGSNALIISKGTTTVARLRMDASSFVAGSGAIDGASTGSFQLTSVGTTDTLVTVIPKSTGGITASGVAAEWTGVTNGATIDWTDAAHWAGGSANLRPGQFQNVQITLGSTEGTATFAALRPVPDYKITVTSAQSAGSVNFDDPFATLVLSAALTLNQLPGQTNGAGFGAHGGRVDIANGGTLTTSAISVNSNAHFQMDPGGLLNISGVTPFTRGNGLAGLNVEGQGQVQGGTISSGGNIVVGANSNADLQISNDITSTGTASTTYGTHGSHVTSTYTRIGVLALTGAQIPLSTLTVQGPNTIYTDAGGDTSTPFDGAMFVGGGYLQVNGLGLLQLATGGNGQLNVFDGATLNDAAYAMIGAGAGSNGIVNVNNSAHWNIGAGSSVPPGSIVLGDTIVGTPTLWAHNLPWLTVGANGTGTLNINSSTVQLSSGEAFNTPKMVIGGFATGTVSLQNTGALLDTGGGPLLVGLNASGSLSVGNGASLHVGAALATTGIGFGLGIGGKGGASQVDVSQATITDDADLVVGMDTAGSLSLSSNATVQAAGGLYIGGLVTHNDGTVVTAATLVKGTASGTVTVGAGSTLGVAGSTIDIWQGSTLALTGGQLALGGATPVAGELVIGSGATLQGAGLVRVLGGDFTLRNDGIVIAGGLTDGGLPSQVGATLELGALLAGRGHFEIMQSATLQLDLGVSSASTFDIGPGNLTSLTPTEIRAINPLGFHGTVADFYGTSEHIDFVGAGYQGAGSLTYTANADPTTGGSINVNTTLGLVQFAVTEYHPGGFAVASDGTTGTLVTANDSAPCFVAGTRILTASGERTAESLQPGDLVPTVHGGRLRRVVWIGVTRIELDRHAEPDRVAPVRIRAGAFAPGAPARDLLVSPDHAVWTGTILVPAYLLDNGLTILREPPRGAVTYVHVELDSHDLVLAEGLAAESYLDTGNRGLFAGEPGARELHPDLLADISARAWDERACVPLTLGGKALLAAHADLRARAAALGHELTAEPGLVLTALGRILTPLASDDGRIVVTLPPGAGEVRLVSRSVVPNQLDPTLDDRRRLGVAIAGIRHSGAALRLDDDVCAAGFHRPEQAGSATMRWTDGAARLSFPPSAVPSRLEIMLLPGMLRYPAPTPQALRAAG